MFQGPLHELLTTRYQALEERLQAACRRAGRERSEVTLVAVTKTVTPMIAALLPEIGMLDLGENRPQELWRKAAVLLPQVRWHLIGHLQRNKIERSVPLVHLIHSVDSLRLLQALEETAERRQQPLQVLLEVNASGEANKHGFSPDSLLEIASSIKTLQYIRVRGLMTMAAFEEDPEQCRPTFVLLRQLRDWLSEQLEPPHSLDHLSMGMTHDFEIAIEEGATLVRIGTALFGDLPELDG